MQVSESPERLVAGTAATQGRHYRAHVFERSAADVGNVIEGIGGALWVVIHEVPAHPRLYCDDSQRVPDYVVQLARYAQSLFAGPTQG